MKINGSFKLLSPFCFSLSHLSGINSKGFSKLQENCIGPIKEHTAKNPFLTNIFYKKWSFSASWGTVEIKGGCSLKASFNTECK